MTIDIRMIRDRLPQQIADLESEARQEGYRHITRLIDEWSAGDVRFEGNGERLLGAYGACRRRGHDRRSGHVGGVADAAFLYQSRNARARHRPDACPGRCGCGVSISVPQCAGAASAGCLPWHCSTMRGRAAASSPFMRETMARRNSGSRSDFRPTGSADTHIVSICMGRASRPDLVEADGLARQQPLDIGNIERRQPGARLAQGG